jgi:hypothetical protein
MGFSSKKGLEQKDFQIVLRAAGETDTTPENIQDWVELDEGDPGFQLLTGKEIGTVIIFLFIFISTLYNIKFSIDLLSEVFFLL